MNKRRGISITEILIVVTVIAALCCIAVPNLEKSNLRSKVVITHDRQRTMAGAIEAYHLDNGAYPLDSQLRAPIYTISELTTPIAYLPDLSNQYDIFVQDDGQVTRGPGLPGEGLKRTLFYMLFANYEIWGSPNNIILPRPSFAGWCLSSVGPSKMDDTVIWRVRNLVTVYEYDPSRFVVQDFNNGIYDPSNGTISNGDIARVSLPDVADPNINAMLQEALYD